MSKKMLNGTSPLITVCNCNVQLVPWKTHMHTCTYAHAHTHTHTAADLHVRHCLMTVCLVFSYICRYQFYVWTFQRPRGLFRKLKTKLGLLGLVCEFKWLQAQYYDSSNRTRL